MLDHEQGGKTIVAFVVPGDGQDADGVFEPIAPLPEGFWHATVDRAAAFDRHPLAPHDLESIRQFTQAGDDFALAVIRSVLAELGWSQQVGAERDLRSEMARSGLSPRYTTLLEQWCTLL